MEGDESPPSLPAPGPVTESTARPVGSAVLVGERHTTPLRPGASPRCNGCFVTDIWSRPRGQTFRRSEQIHRYGHPLAAVPYRVCESRVRCLEQLPKHIRFLSASMVCGGLFTLPICQIFWQLLCVTFVDSCTTAFPVILIRLITRMPSTPLHIAAGLMRGKNRIGSVRQALTLTCLTSDTGSDRKQRRKRSK